MSEPPRPPDVLRDGAVSLRPLAERDWCLDHALSRDDVTLRWTTHPADLDEAAARARVREAMGARAAGRRVRWAVDHEGATVGTAGVNVHDRSTVEIYYGLLPPARGRGIAARAARLLAEWAAGAGYRDITLVIFPGNVASRRTARRAGFIEVGHVEQERHGRVLDLVAWRYEPRPDETRTGAP